MSNNQRLHFNTTDHPVLFSSITNNDNNESDVRSNSNVNEEVDEDSSSSCSSNNSNSNSNRPSTPCFGTANFEDFNVDEEGRLIGLFGVPWKNITVKSLRPLGKSLNIRGYSNLSKNSFINAISFAYNNRNIYSTDVDASTRKTRNCPYRLLNILFSDEFAGEFASIGDAGTRADLDAGSASNNRGFWQKIECAYTRKEGFLIRVSFQRIYI